MTPYEQLLARLLPARRFGVVLGLDRMHAIFARLGHPETRLGRVIHVGGTNGKGSTVKFIADLLRSSGRVAMYTSPHLSTLRERIQLDGELITEDAIVAASDQVRAAGGDELTFFEQLTAIACVAIAGQVDFTVLEVGLGGRLDATNAIPAEVAVVTGVAMDHAAILGDTLDKIAREKAGIFKLKQKVVIGASGDPAAVPTLIEAARHVAARVAIVGKEDIERVQSHRGWRHGEFQRRNAAAAIAAVGNLDKWVGALDIASLEPPPGRVEEIDAGDLDLILDGAHNPHAAAALALELRSRDTQPMIVVAVSADKDVAGIVAALAPIARGVIATRYHQDRALAPDALAEMFRAVTGVPIETAPDLATALARIRDPAGPFFRTPSGSVIHPRPEVLITGSLFLVGEARTLLLRAPTDPYVVTDPPATP